MPNIVFFFSYQLVTFSGQELRYIYATSIFSCIPNLNRIFSFFGASEVLIWFLSCYRFIELLSLLCFSIPCKKETIWKMCIIQSSDESIKMFFLLLRFCLSCTDIKLVLLFYIILLFSFSLFVLVTLSHELLSLSLWF